MKRETYKIILIFLVSFSALTCDEGPKNNNKSIRKILASQSQEYYCNIDINHHKEYSGEVPSICFMGDSRIDWFEVDCYWPDRKILNIARAGSTIDGVLWRLPQVREWKPDIIFISIGGNDARSNSSNSREYIKKFTIVLNEIRKIDPKPEIFISNIVPVSNDFIITDNVLPLFLAKQNLLTSFVYDLRLWNMRINDFNKALKNFCEEQDDVTYIDLIEFEDSTGGLNPLYTVEGIHYNTKGYELLSRILHEYF